MREATKSAFSTTVARWATSGCTQQRRASLDQASSAKESGVVAGLGEVEGDEEMSVIDWEGVKQKCPSMSRRIGGDGAAFVPDSVSHLVQGDSGDMV